MIRKDEKKEERVELVALKGIEKPASGKLGFEFRNMTFLMTDLVIESKLEPVWAKKTLVSLKKAGKLKVKAEEPAVAAKKEGQGAKQETPAAPQQLPQKSKRGLGKIDINQPDPEAEDEL